MSTSMPTPKPRFTGIFIPAEILEIPGLSSTDILLLSWIDALQCKEHGGCYASNSYLAAMLRLKENTIKILISKLKDLGLVEQVSFDGRTRILRTCKENIFKDFKDPICPKKSKVSTSGVDKNIQSKSIKVIPRRLEKSTPPIYVYSKVERKEESKGASAPALADFSSKETRLERALHVTTSMSDHQKLLDKLGKDLTAQCYQRLSEWKQDTPKSKWKKDDYRSILRWVIDSIKEDKFKKSKITSSLDSPEENKAHARRIADNFNPVRCRDKGCRIELMTSEVQIISNNSFVQPICIRYSEKGFKEQLENAMRKFQLY